MMVPVGPGNGAIAPASNRSTGESLLEVRDLRIDFEDRGRLVNAVRDVSLRVAEGEVLGIVGESGSGKTVSCLAAMGLLNGWPGVVGGSVRFKGRDGHWAELLGGLPSTLKTQNGMLLKRKRQWNVYVNKVFKPLWGSGMTMIFQDPQNALNPYWTVGKIIEEAVDNRYAGRKSAKEMKAEGYRWIERVRLKDPERLWKAYPHELSGGMAQRVMIAAALARGARLLIADEPTTGLDTTVKASIVELFSTLRREENLAMIVVSHDLGVVSALADRVVVMFKGEILESCTVDDIICRSPKLDDYTRRLIDAVDVWKADCE